MPQGTLSYIIIMRIYRSAVRMRASLDFLEESYRKFNQECFAWTLPVVPLHISRSRRMLGCLRFVRGRCGGHETYRDFSIHISNRLDMPRNVVEDTLIHEMIHLYIVYNGLKDSSAHGPVFRAMMAEINRRHGRNVTVTHMSSAEENASDEARRAHYMCLTTFRTGEKLLTLCARTRIFEFHRRLGMMEEVEAVEWFYSSSPLFNRFPRSRTLKFYRIPEDLIPEIESARKCVCDGTTLRFA